MDTPKMTGIEVDGEGWPDDPFRILFQKVQVWPGLARLRFYAKWLAQIMLYVTAGHEQAGAVEAMPAAHAKKKTASGNDPMNHEPSGYNYG